jgi:hypothetical protein
MVLGVWLKRSGALRAEHVPVLNGLVVNVTLPALVIHSLATAPSVPKSTLWLPLAMIVGEYLTMAVAYGIARALRMPTALAGALLLVGTFGNTGFLGYPIILALYPHQFTATILVDQIGMGIILFTSAPVLGALLTPQPHRLPPTEFAVQGKKGGASVNAPVPSALPQKRSEAGRTHGAPRRQAMENIAAFFRSPLFIAMLMGIVIRLIPWPAALRHNGFLGTAGSVVAQCLTYLGQGTVPLIMLSMGAALRPEAGRVGVKPLALACVLKLLFIPLIVWQCLRFVGVHGEMLTVGVMLASMPSSVMSSVLAQHNGFDSDYSVGVVFVTTVISALMLPLWVMLAR